MPPTTTRSDPRSTALAVVALAFLFNFVARGVADVFAAFILPLETEFGWSRRSMTGVYATYLLTSGLAAPASGWVFDRFGPRTAYGLGLVLLAGGTWLAGWTRLPWHLYLSAGVMVGLGVAALGMVSATTLIGRWYRHNLSTAIAVAYAGFGSGILVMMPLAQWLIERHGWRDAWHAIGLGVAALIPVCLALPWRRLAAGLDGGGPRRGAADGDAAPRPGPTLRDALRSRRYWQLVQAFFFTSFASYLVTPQTVAFLVESGYAPLTAATAYGTAGLLSTFGVIAVGWLVGRVGYGRTALLSYVSTGIGVAALLAASYGASLAVLVVHVAFFGVVQGARGPIISTLSNRIFAGGSAGTIYGTVFLGMALGASSGSLVGGVLHDLTGGYRAIFLLSLVSLGVAAAPFRRGSPILREADAGR